MKKLLKLMLQNNMLRAPEGDPAKGEDGANGGGGADKGSDLSAYGQNKKVSFPVIMFEQKKRPKR